MPLEKPNNLTNEEIAEFLNEKDQEDLKKKIELCAFLNKCSNAVDIEDYNAGKKTIILTIFKHIKGIINHFFPRIAFYNCKNKQEYDLFYSQDLSIREKEDFCGEHGEKAEFIELRTWLCGYRILGADGKQYNDSYAFYDITRSSLDKYFERLSKNLSGCTEYVRGSTCKIKVYIDDVDNSLIINFTESV